MGATLRLGVFLVLALACLAHAQYNNQYTTPVPILKQINRHNDDGSYSYGYEGADGSFKIESKHPTGEVYGKYGYVDDVGKVREIEYGASRRGFEPTGTGINVPPPTLHGNSLAPDGYDDGQYHEDPSIYYKNEYSSNANKQPPKSYYNPPAQQRSYNPPAQQSYYNPPAQKSYYNPPAQQSHYNPPAQQSHNNPPAQQHVYNPPAQQSHYNSPAQQHVYNPPAQQSHYNPPAQQSHYNPPAQQHVYNPPAQQRTYNPPAQQHQYNPPQERYYNPSPQQHYAPAPRVPVDPKVFQGHPATNFNLEAGSYSITYEG